MRSRMNQTGHGRQPEFTRNHQLAILLVRHLGVSGAIQACYNNHWYGVLRAVEEQNASGASAA